MENTIENKEELEIVGPGEKINSQKILVELRQLYRIFDNNKFWIISVLYVSAIVKDYIWYSMFGINILSFASIQDTFISLLNHTMIFVVIAINYILCKLLPFKNIFIIIILFLPSIICYFLFKKIASILYFLSFLSFFSALYKYKSIIIRFSLIFLFTLTIIEPLCQGFFLRTNYIQKGMIFILDESNMEYISFETEDKLIDTALNKYLMVGSTKDNFFIFDREIKKTLVISKSDCKNIKGEFKIF
jgi:hypothetical protein